MNDKIDCVFRFAVTCLLVFLLGVSVYALCDIFVIWAGL